MQALPTGWGTVFAGPHQTEYKFVIDGVEYTGADVKGTPVISKPLLDKPAIGRCCTASAKLTIYPKADIPRAASVDAYCRLRSLSAATVTDWLPQGKFYITQRNGKNPQELSCLDAMIKAGVMYQDKTAFDQWPQAMADVVDDIADIMGVTVDSRTEIQTGADYVVDYPNEDVLISEVLGMIAAAHGGNWIITEAGALRLVVLADPSVVAEQDIGKEHTGFKLRGKVREITRVTLTDGAGNEFTAGDDTGTELSVRCDYATQAIADRLCDDDGNPASVLYGTQFRPYTLTGAYLDPAVELGDTIAVTDRGGTSYTVVAESIELRCTVSATCNLSTATEDETGDEFPYISARDLTLKRSVRTDATYFGNRINRSEGFVSERVVNGNAVARLTANANTFSMQVLENGAWVDRIYFDAATGKYVIAGEVKVQSVSDLETDLATSGATVINGGNITTGTINASKVTINNINASKITTGTLSADRIDVDSLHIKKLYFDHDSNPAITAAVFDTYYETVNSQNTLGVIIGLNKIYGSPTGVSWSLPKKVHIYGDAVQITNNYSTRSEDGIIFQQGTSPPLISAPNYSAYLKTLSFNPITTYLSIPYANALYVNSGHLYFYNGSSSTMLA